MEVWLSVQNKVVNRHASFHALMVVAKNALSHLCEKDRLRFLKVVKNIANYRYGNASLGWYFSNHTMDAWRDAYDTMKAIYYDQDTCIENNKLMLNPHVAKNVKTISKYEYDKLIEILSKPQSKIPWMVNKTSNFQTAQRIEKELLLTLSRISLLTLMRFMSFHYASKIMKMKLNLSWYKRIHPLKPSPNL